MFVLHLLFSQAEKSLISKSKKHEKLSIARANSSMNFKLYGATITITIKVLYTSQFTL